MWFDILKKERDIFPNIDAIRVEYSNKVSTIINMLKNMKKEVNSKIKSYNKVNEIISENRPLDIPSLDEFQIDYVGQGLGGRYTRLLNHIPEELRDKFHRQFVTFNYNTNHWETPDLTAKELKDWINEHSR